MKKSSNMYKIYVNGVLMNCPQEYISYTTLINGKEENFEPVFYYLIELLDNLEKKSNKYICKLLNSLISYIECFNDNKYNLSEQIKDRIRKVKNDYQEIIKNKNEEPDKNIIETIEELIEKIDNNCFENEQEKEEQQKEELIDKKIEELNNKVVELKQEIDHQKEKNDKKKKLLYEEINRLKETINEITNLKNILEQENNNYNNELTKSNNENKKLQDEINRLKELNLKLKSFLISAENKTKEVEIELQKLKKEEEAKEKQEQINKELDNKIISLFLNSVFTLNKLEIVLNNNGFKCTESEILESLKRIRTTVNITNHHKKAYPQVYQVTKPIYDSNCNFRINNFSDTLDLLITADWHITSTTSFEKTIAKIDKIYNYCAGNNIELIINLGDFLDIEQNSREEKYFTTMKLLDDIIEKFPKDENITHAILGGNHDRRMFEVGVDPLQYIDNNRSDYINIGYDCARLLFSRNTENQAIGLHHPDAYSINVYDIPELQKYIIEYLNKMNETNAIDDYQMYLNLFGHFHVSRMDYENSYCMVPALMRTNVYNQSGMIHLRLYFDQLGNIEYLTIKSLVSDKQLLPVNEIVYQKRK